jgi:lipocalin
MLPNTLKQLSIFLLISSFQAFGSIGQEYQEINSPLRNLNLGKLQGKWFEIASTKNENVPDLYCTTKLIKMLGPDQIFIQNSFRKSLPESEVFNNELGFVFNASLPGIWTLKNRQTEEYKIISFIQVEFNYQSAVAIGKNGLPVVVLSRSPEMDVVKLASIRGRLISKGYDVSDLKQTLQQGCWPPVKANKIK